MYCLGCLQPVVVNLTLPYFMLTFKAKRELEWWLKEELKKCVQLFGDGSQLIKLLCIKMQLEYCSLQVLKADSLKETNFHDFSNIILSDSCKAVNANTVFGFWMFLGFASSPQKIISSTN